MDLINSKKDPVYKAISALVFSHIRNILCTWIMLHKDNTTTNNEPHSQEIDLSCFKFFLEGASNAFKNDDLGWEIALIAFPALVALTADPLASMVDTYFIGQLGSVELAAVGVSIAIFNLVSKLMNIPLLNLTTSLVAEEDATDSGTISEIELETGKLGSLLEESQTLIVANKGSGENDGIQVTNTMARSNAQPKPLPAASTALVLGFVLGFFELFLLTIGSGKILDVMGVTEISNMRAPAKQYLEFRAIGSPAVVLSLVAQGIFRGFKDTQTPLFATTLGNVVNMILVPILMFKYGYGVGGSAIATVTSQYLITLILLMKLRKKVVLFPPKLIGLHFGLFIRNGGLLLARSAAVMLSLTFATSLIARLGAFPMAAHQICMQVWLATSLLSDAIALAGQAIIASALGKGNYQLAKDAAFRTLQIGFALGLILSALLGIALGAFTKLFTNNTTVQKFLAIGTPFVAASQPFNSLAFVFDGLHFGASDYSYAAYSMITAAVFTSGFMLIVSRLWGFLGIWIGLLLLMALRMVIGFLRVGTASGPWKFLKTF
ncbi:hypothetical protein KP509_1Z024500 [Ceratopteris richardii]|nr:hypothetical protein KP509_1Z024500 [Ceratopteris richardii]KAH6559171.1 hypothetical protein KP509_1Z024500 [Ceratopteris richardii]KAH6559172.1 hypothetical protein KP509_1Z024500 [Ceratopteris richardii]KAH6559173.1 hypothetical protein KP509_1Z024500 [Ceratopteris richardii]